MTQKELPENTLANVRIFLVDDEDLLAWSMESELKALGAETTRAANVRDAIKRFPHFGADVAITDLSLPDGTGLELLKKWRHEYPDIPIILVTAHGAIDSAITALRLGAFDYLQKPLDMKAFVTAVKRAAEIAKLRQKVSRLQGRVREREQIEIIGSSPNLELTLQRLRRIATSRGDTVLITGESGTGKELAARALHWWSDRAAMPFVEINCASIPENLLESELFGHERGAFTDARERKLGLLEMAREGTIFLDEIGEMPIKLQSKLLRVLEYRRFKRLGGVKDIEFNAQIVAATNRNLLQEVKQKNFREDLYYRLNVLPVNIPSLRERSEDIPLLVEHFLREFAQRLEITPPRVSSAAMHILQQYRWPGNIRELRNLLQRALVFHSPTELTPEHLQFDTTPAIENAEWTVEAAIKNTPLAELPTTTWAAPISDDLAHSDCAKRAGGSVTVSNWFSLPEAGVSLDGVEKNFILQALEKAKNNQTRAAQLLGVSRHTLRYRLEKHGIIH